MASQGLGALVESKKWEEALALVMRMWGPQSYQKLHPNWFGKDVVAPDSGADDKEIQSECSNRGEQSRQCYLRPSLALQPNSATKRRH